MTTETASGGLFARLYASPFGEGLRKDYQDIFVEQWSPYVGAILMVAILAALMISGQFWGIFGGLKLWGDWFNNAISLGPWLGVKPELESPLSHRMSLMNASLIIGSFAAALLSRQFAVNRAPRLEYIWGALGGALMGIGASLAGGCTTGGFFTPVVHSSPAGWAMWAGLLIGAVVGLKLLLWTLDHITWGMQAKVSADGPVLLAWYPWFGALVLVAMGWWATSWAASGDAKLAARAIVILAGLGLGFVMQRARICFARAFREPFMTAEGDMTKAIILALALAIPVAAVLFDKKIMDPYVAIPATFWAGSLIGGFVFGVGMVFAGGCASGALWRMGEGHLKLWVAGFFFAWGGSSFSAFVRRWDLLTPDQNLDTLLDETKVGAQVFMPQAFDGWGWAFLVSFGILLAWYLFVRYNESTEKFTVL